MSTLSDEKLKAWDAANRAPLDHNKLNRWVFIVRKEHAADDENIERVIGGVLNRLEVGRSVDDYRLVRTSPTRITGKGTRITREKLPLGPIPVLAPTEGVRWAEVEFAWRSPTDSVPWPAERMRFGLIPEQDPLLADVVLDSVAQNAGDAKEPQSPIAEAIDDAIDAATETPQRVAVTGLVVVGALGFLLYQWKK